MASVVSHSTSPFLHSISTLPNYTRSHFITLIHNTMTVTTSTPAPKLKMSYFNVPYMGEPIRNAFIIGGIDFEDHRVPYEDWSAMKPSMPFGSLPILTVDDDKVYSQSDAILLYAGKITGLYPRCPEKAMKVDEILGGAYDLLASVKDRSEEGLSIGCRSL